MDQSIRLHFALSQWPPHFQLMNRAIICFLMVLPMLSMFDSINEVPFCSVVVRLQGILAEVKQYQSTLDEVKAKGRRLVSRYRKDSPQLEQQVQSQLDNIQESYDALLAGAVQVEVSRPRPHHGARSASPTSAFTASSRVTTSRKCHVVACSNPGGIPSGNGNCKSPDTGSQRTFCFNRDCVLELLFEPRASLKLVMKTMITWPVVFTKVCVPLWESIHRPLAR